MKYIKLFNQHNPDYETYITNESSPLPNMSYCIDEQKLHLNPFIDYSKQYLTIVALEDGTITFKIPAQIVAPDITSISYSVNNGKTWITENNDNFSILISINVKEGDRVLWKGIAHCMSNARYSAYFQITTMFNLEGNIMSLCYGDDFINQTDLEYTTQFAYIFKNCYVINAKNLILPAMTLTNNCYENMFVNCNLLTIPPKLPATTLAQGCYYRMFYGCTELATAPELPATTMAQGCYESMFGGCTSLTTAPELPATILVDYCYNNMFKGCTSLNYIKAMFTTTPGSDYTSNWMSNVAVTGTFVKNSEAEWDVTGVNGIPENWTVETADE